MTHKKDTLPCLHVDKIETIQTARHDEKMTLGASTVSNSASSRVHVLVNILNAMTTGGIPEASFGSLLATNKYHDIDGTRHSFRASTNICLQEHDSVRG
jgi:hypothetical protein